MSSASKVSAVYHVCFRWSPSSTLDQPERFDELIHQFCIKYFDKFIYQLEDSKPIDGHNYHYQGYGHVIDVKVRPGALIQGAISMSREFAGIQIDASSTAGIEALKNYSMKKDTRVRGPWADGTRYLGEDLVPTLWSWQEDVKHMVEGPIHPREINCIINEEGNIGKSAFCKYMAYHHDIPVLGWGKTGDLLNLVSKMPNKRAYFFDLARTKPKDWAGGDIYSAMEGVKNGHFVNTKYETKSVLMKQPHVWIFTNNMPDMTTMSSDRWKLWCIQGRTLHRLSRGHLRSRRYADTGRRRSASPGDFNPDAECGTPYINLTAPDDDEEDYKSA